MREFPLTGTAGIISAKKLSGHKIPGFRLYVTIFNVTYFFVTLSIVEFFKAMADLTRWRIIRLVRENALCVCELADILGMPQSSVSSHVQVIRKAGMLESEKCEKWTYFRIDARFLKLIRDMERFFEDAGASAWADDAANAAARLAKRENSCCPGPKKLASRYSELP